MSRTDNRLPRRNYLRDIRLFFVREPAAESYITGFDLVDAAGYATSSQITGKAFASDMADPTPIRLTTAVGDMETAFTDAAGRPEP
ncbi:MAG: DUF3494 domain-containing protein [Balneolaceae bacterium]|nr:MAG: DUF3494 domain-containing protein [Balneolaceae bacterium]